MAIPIFIPALICAICLYGIALPILPEAVVSKINSSEIAKYFFNGEITLYPALVILLFLSSCYVISFRLFRDKNFVSKLFIGGLIVMGLAMIAGKFETIIVAMVCFTLPVIVAIVILCIPKNKKSSKENKFKKNKSVKGENKGFVFQTKQGVIHLENPYRGIYIQGGAGSGKSVSVFEPIISQLSVNNYTGLLYDFKSPELTRKVLMCYRNNSSIKTYFVDFKNPYLSDRVNPIDPKYLEKTAYALEYSTVLINNLLPESVKKMDFWSSNAKMILAGVIWYLRNKHPHYCSIPHVISLLLHTDVDKLIGEISTDYEAGGMVASLKQAIDRGAEKQVAGVLSTIQNGLSQLNTPDIFWVLSGNDLNLHLNNPADPKFLCLGNDSTLASTYAPVISLIISVSLRLMNQPGQNKSVILLDEAPTVYIPNIEQVPATARSNKVATVFGVQDYSQLSDKYGESKAQVILANLGNQFYGRSVNVKSAESISKLFGRHDKMFESTSKGSGSSGQFIHLSGSTNKGKSEGVQERDRVKVSDITNLGAGQFYGIIAEGSPTEFLNTQFMPSEIDSDYTFKNKATPQQLSDNYLRVVNEAKTIIK